MSLTTTMVTVEWYDKKTDTTQWQTFNPFSSAFFASKGNLTQSAAGAKGFESCVYSVNPHILENYSAGYFRAFNIQRPYHPSV
jgi:hypothetical protein